MISKFRKISQENRVAAQNTANIAATAAAATAPTSTSTASGSIQQASPKSIVSATGSESVETFSRNDTNSSFDQNTPLLPPPILKMRDKLETISERIETQQSQISQITSVHQSPPLQRPPKSSKWKWLKTGSTGPEVESPPRGALPTIKASPPQPPHNPFDSNLTEDDLSDTKNDGPTKRPQIPLTLMIPKKARFGNTNLLDVDPDEMVNFSISLIVVCLPELVPRSIWMIHIQTLICHLGLAVVYHRFMVITT